jgi:hypothetical protein
VPLPVDLGPFSGDSLDLPTEIVAAVTASGFFPVVLTSQPRSALLVGPDRHALGFRHWLLLLPFVSVVTTFANGGRP